MTQPMMMSEKYASHVRPLGVMVAPRDRQPFSSPYAAHRFLSSSRIAARC
jgi:hypothetical protein